VATLAVVFLQHAINLFNDVSDWKLGADTHKYDSWVRVFSGNTRPVFWQGVLSAVAGAVLGLLVLALSDKFWILYIATPLVLLGYLYNAGSRPLSYTVLGEWVTGLCYGGVFACLFLLDNGELTLSGIAGMITFACVAMALLLSHQPPQIDTDRAAGKHTFAVRYGKAITLKSVQALLLVAVTAFAVALWLVDCGACAGVFISLSAFVAISSLRDVINPKSVLLSATLVFVFTLVVSFISPLI
jgi:1,4-dihydroxy-2-naphthoate octaprenyltransferase